MTPTDKKISRRDFVRGVGGIGLLSAFPTIIPSSAFGANEAIRIGHIGVRNRGMQNLFPLMKHTVAVCDVDKDVLAKAKGEGREGRPDRARPTPTTASCSTTRTSTRSSSPRPTTGTR